MEVSVMTRIPEDGYIWNEVHFENKSKNSPILAVSLMNTALSGVMVVKRMNGSFPAGRSRHGGNKDAIVTW